MNTSLQSISRRGKSAAGKSRYLRNPMKQYEETERNASEHVDTNMSASLNFKQLRRGEDESQTIVLSKELDDSVQSSQQFATVNVNLSKKELKSSSDGSPIKPTQVPRAALRAARE